MPNKVRAARRTERIFVAACGLLFVTAFLGLAPYWAFRVLLVCAGFYLALVVALVNGMVPAGSGDKAGWIWNVLAYGGIVGALVAAVYFPSLSRQEFLYWRYAIVQPQELADLRLEFRAAPVRFNEPEAKQIFPGAPIRCELYFPDEPQGRFGTNGCYFWTRSFNGLPGKMTDFAFARDRLNAVRLEVPFWSNRAWHDELTRQFGVPGKNLQSGLLGLMERAGGAPGMLLSVSTPSLSTWQLPTGILVMNERYSWFEPTGLILFMSRSFLCENRSEASKASPEMARYCA